MGTNFEATTFLQAIGLVYAIAFCSIYSQVQGLYGEDGVEPVSAFIARVHRELGDQKLQHFAHLPSLVWFHEQMGLSPDLMMELLCLVGMVLATLATTKWFIAPESFGVMWLSYLSIVLMGGSFMRTQWDALLLEVGFIAIWIAPPFGNLSVFEPPQAMLWALRFVFVKYNFMTSGSKILSGDLTWLGLTAFDFHFATQEVPNTFSWYAHQLSPGVHSIWAAMSLFIQGPLSLLGISPCAEHRYPVIYLNVALQLVYLFTGNYGFSNILVIALGYSLFPATSDMTISDRLRALKYTYLVLGFAAVVYAAYNMFDVVYENEVATGLRYSWTLRETKLTTNYVLPVVIFGGYSLVALASFVQNARLFYFGCQDLLKCRLTKSVASGHCVMFTVIGALLFGGLAVPLAKMNATYAETLPNFMKTAEIVTSKLRLSSPYGNFQKSTGVRKVTVPGTFINEFAIVARPEIIIEGSDDDGKTWQAYEFNSKPGNVNLAPKLVAPHLSRLDWQMAAAAKGNYSEHPWLVNFVNKLLHGSPTVLQLLDKAPFEGTPPKSIRAQLYHYDFTRWNTSWAREIPYVEILSSNTKNGSAWWTRTFVKDYLPAVDLKNPSLKKFVDEHGWSSKKVDSKDPCGASTQPGLCQSLVTLHSISNIREYLIAAFAIFMFLKYQVESKSERTKPKEKTD
ncbi:hypothetical protein LEN26_000442 [Aphanomyces euteiches]|nr:hypothetical protein AeMF1_016840 [Aphanomyces euteiches]KAH9163550.1 hypothetical protein LEN26_000442 [Aphanomyces euteiches]KAH9188626.1 hypothetical protein AeNC1_009394 [Aphanomyces euteiches]